MRFINQRNALKLYVVAGTQTVLLSFDIDQKLLKGKGFMGFDVERRDSRGATIKLNGTKHFASLLRDPTITDPSLKNASLVQSFFWKDYTADPGETYTYTVRAMFGTAIHHQPGYETSITVSTEPLRAGKHSVFFNYGVTGSQGYAKKKEFGNKKINKLTGAVREAALAYLGRELWKEGLVTFVRQARGAEYGLYGAFYELQYPGFLEEIKAAKESGAEVQIIYSAQSGQKKKNENAIAAAGLGSEQMCHPRTKAAQPHNKFMVLCRNQTPVQLWTGSTNITLAGIFGQSNTGHWIEDERVAGMYLDYWKVLQGNPALPKLAETSMLLQPDADLTALADGTYVFFSPRDLPAEDKKTPPHLQNYARLIDAAKELVCMIFPFNMDPVFKAVYQKDKPYLRLLIFDKSSEAARAKSNDRDMKVTAGAVLDSPVEQWVKEVTSKATTDAGVLYVHNKFFIVDPLGDDPVVVSGSANFSAASITSNDENTILVKGDARVADIYLTEFDRLFEHFWPRYLRELDLKKGKMSGSKSRWTKPANGSATIFPRIHTAANVG